MASHLTRHLREPLRATVEVTRAPVEPQILLRVAGQTVYRILLNTGDTYWAQYTYQFGHEFCHLVAGYEQRFETPNQWVEETLCELASLFTLRSMAVTWKTHPPYPNWRDFAPALSHYASGEMAKVQMPAADVWPVWLWEHEARARADPYLRRRQQDRCITAVAALPRRIQPAGTQCGGYRRQGNGPARFSQTGRRRCARGIASSSRSSKRRWAWACSNGPVRHNLHCVSSQNPLARAYAFRRSLLTEVMGKRSSG